MILLCKGHFDTNIEDVLTTGLKIIWERRCMLPKNYVHLGDLVYWLVDIAESFCKDPNLMTKVLEHAHPKSLSRQFGWRKEEVYDYDIAIIEALASHIRHIEVVNFLPDDLGKKDRIIEELIMEELMRL